MLSIVCMFKNGSKGSSEPRERSSGGGRSSKSRVHPDVDFDNEKCDISTEGSSYSMTPRNSDRKTSMGKNKKPAANLTKSKIEIAVQTAIQEELVELGNSVSPWTGQFTFVKTLQEAKRNHGRVDLMNTPDGKSLAVKRMPNKWVTKSPEEFAKAYPTASEKPWYDYAIVRMLDKQGFKNCCQFKGMFRDASHSYVCTTLASGGDIFCWCGSEQLSSAGPKREAEMLPVIIQIVSGVRHLHDLGIGHRDLSLENILLTGAGDVGGPGVVKIIDFGMATTERHVIGEVRGKASYQAPEMHHKAESYDTFLIDSFALGVIMYAMALQDYPWSSTKEGACQLFEYAKMFGFHSFLKKRKVRGSRGSTVTQVMTTGFIEMILGMVIFNPEERWSVGEKTWASDSSDARKDIWSSQWMAGVTVPRIDTEKVSVERRPASRSKDRKGSRSPRDCPSSPGREPRRSKDATNSKSSCSPEDPICLGPTGRENGDRPKQVEIQSSSDSSSTPSTAASSGRDADSPSRAKARARTKP